MIIVTNQSLNKKDNETENGNWPPYIDKNTINCILRDTQIFH